MKHTKRIITLTLVVILVLAFTGIANAASISITSANSSISNLGGSVRINSYTGTSPTATKIKHYMVLQRYNGGWQTYSSSTRYGYNTNSFLSSTTKSVASGYNYRLVTYHTVYSGTTIVATRTTYSSQIYIS